MSEIKVRKKRKANIASLLLTFAFLFAAGYLLYQVLTEVRSTFQLKSDLKEAQVILAQIQEENIDLSEQKAKLEDPEYVKSYARGTYMLTKDGEQIFFLPSSLENSDE